LLESDAAEFSLEWINGEAEPHTYRAGRPVPAGALHLGTQPIILAASETWQDSLLHRLTETTRGTVRLPSLEKLLKFYLIAIVLANPEILTELNDDSRLALARLANGSLHPVSRSLLEALGIHGQHALRTHGTNIIEDIPGMGRQYTDKNGTWTLGRPGWAYNSTMETSPHDAELCHNAKPIACFHFQESLRPDAISAISSLKKRYRIVILSGDKSEKVIATANALHINANDAHAALQPCDKERIVRSLDKHDTLYLGDGANDSLAFNVAFVTGTPVVDRSLLETKSDFFFLGQSLRFLPLMLNLARLRRHTAAIAFGFALIYNAAAITASLLGYMNPLIAAIIMPLSSAISIAIVAYGLREKKGT
jgi:P-type Cu2+ transporter